MSRYLPAGRQVAARLSLREALTTRWPWDAHVTGYDSPMRRSRDFLGASMSMLFVDVDAPKHLPTSAWRNEVRAVIRRVNAMHPVTAWYHTLGGARVGWRLLRPYAVNDSLDAHRWSLAYDDFGDELSSLGLDIDRTCRDWSRLYRLPFVVRPGRGDTLDILRAEGLTQVLYVDENAKPLDLAPFLRSAESGSEEGPGAEGAAMRDQLAAHTALHLARRDGSTSPPSIEVDSSLGACLWRMFDARDRVLRVTSERVYVDCPWLASHGSVTGWRDSLLWRASGLYYCAHYSCYGRSTIDSVNTFTRAERIQAGMTGVREAQ